MTLGKKASKDFPILKKNLDHIKIALVKHDFDFLLVIEGYERTGKSTLALQVCKYIDPDFTAEQVVFDVHDFNKLVWTLGKGRAILIDEGATALFSRDAMSAGSREGVKILTTMGARNLFVVICVPNFSILDKYIREHRVRSLIRVVARGTFKYYSKDKVRKSFFNPKLKMMAWDDENFKEHFGKVTGELWEDYTKHKMDYLVGRSEVMDEQIDEVNVKYLSKGLRVSYNKAFELMKAGDVPGAYQHPLTRKWLTSKAEADNYIKGVMEYK